MVKHLVLLILFISLQHAYSQTAKELNNQVLEFYNQGEYEKALPLAVKAVNIIINSTGEITDEEIEILNNLGVLYQKLGKNQQAEDVYKMVTELKKKLYGELSEEYANSLNQLAILNETMKRYDTAINLLTASVNIYTKVNPASPNYPVIITNLASMYNTKKDYGTSAEWYQKLGVVLKKNNGENKAYADNVLMIGLLYEKQSDYENAIKFFVQVSDIYKKLHGDTSLEYFATLQNLGKLYILAGKYQKAEEALIRVLKHSEENGKEKSKDYAVNTLNLAQSYYSLGQYDKAEPLFLKALEITKLLEGESETYAMGLSKLGALYMDKSDYANAEKLFMQALEITKKISGESNNQYAERLNNLGFLYTAMGLNDKAEKMLFETQVIYEMTLGINHPDYATVIHNLAFVYQSLGDYSEAENLYLKALAIRQKTFGENSLLYATSLSYMAGLYREQMLYAKAEPLYKKAYDILKNIFKEDREENSTAAINVGSIYYATGRYDSALVFYNEGLKILKEVFKPTNTVKSVPPYYSTFINIALCYQAMGKFTNAEPFFLKFNTTFFSDVRKDFTILSARDKENYLSEKEFQLEIINSVLYTNPKASGEIKRSNLNVQLLMKSLSLSDTKSLLNFLRNSTDPSIKNIFKTWESKKAALAKQYTLANNKITLRIDSLEIETDALEKQLSRSSEDYRKLQKNTAITMQDIQLKLNTDEAAIEFIKFKIYNKKWTDSIIYAAYLYTKKDSFPIFIPLCEEKQLEQLFASAGKTTTASVSSFYRGVEDTDGDNVSVAKGDSLYKLIWQPLEPYLKGINKISYSPAGKLYTIAFNALPAGDGKILMDKYELQQYTSTRQIALRTNEIKISTPKSIALFGDATFSLDSLQLVTKITVKPNNITASTNIYTPPTRGRSSSAWKNLPGTATEVKNIQQLFTQNNITTKTFVQTQASEENFKSLSGNTPQVLHLATHGFFLPEPDKKRKDLNDGNVYSLAEDPLMRSGILLSGANYAWSGKTPINGVEDGIATAYEISQLDLSKTELVVLSACETALGDIKGSEGVFGLQRAFKMAGVNKLIVSLWQVPDKETSELMTVFYSNWLGGKTIEKAFYTAQSEMRKKYAPFYWAAFVLVE